jgi:hypothetical protein
MAPQRLVGLGCGSRCAGRVGRDAGQVAVVLGDDRDRAVAELRVVDLAGGCRASVRRAAEENARSPGTGLIDASKAIATL